MAFRGKITLYTLLFSLGFSMPAWAEFGLHLGSHFGYGEIGDGTRILPQRSGSTFDLQAMPEWDFMLLRAGIMMEYRWVNEFDRGTAGTSKLSGNSLVFGLAADFVPGPWKFMLGYDFKASHSLTSSNVSYYGSGFRALFGYDLLPSLRFDFQYTKTNFNERKDINGRTKLGSGTMTTGDGVLSYWNLGFGISYTY